MDRFFGGERYTLSFTHDVGGVINRRYMNAAGDIRIVKEGEPIMAKQKPPDYRELRRRAYPPVGDQLDAILKALNQMQMDEVMNMPKPTDEIICKWLTVKKKHPKPE